jgi:hypothetical protein
MLPPFTVSPDLHGAAFVGIGLGIAVVGRGVNIKEQLQVTVSVVDPPTVAE